jgi:hypothetical protein
MSSDRSKEHTTKLTLATLFMAAFIAVASRRRKPSEVVRLRPLDFLLLSLATFRLGRLTAYDKVAEPLRKPFTRTTMDDYGAAETVELRGCGVRRAIGELLARPICAGT